DAGDYLAAARILAPVAEREPTNRSVLELLGRAYFYSAQLRRAEATFRRLIELDPVDAWAHAALARWLARQGAAQAAGRHRRLHAAMTGGSRDCPASAPPTRDRPPARPDPTDRPYGRDRAARAAVGDRARPDTRAAVRRGPAPDAG